MPNAFAGRNLFDARLVRSHRERFHRDLLPMLDRANSFYTATARWPCRGWLLLRRGDYNNVNTYATNLTLQLDDFVNGGITLQHLTVVQAQCVTRGIAADPNAIYLVEVTDRQGIVWNPWFQYRTNSQYNMRSPAYPGQYYSDSLNSGIPWTWDTMLGDLWGQMSTFLGTYPHLPISPAGVPEGFAFPGTSCWKALCDVLDLLGLSVAVNLTQAASYTIVVDGGPDAAFVALQTKYAGLLEDDQEYIDTGSGRVPLNVLVLFHRRNEYFGTEETVRNDALQWSSTPNYSVSVNGPFPNAVGTDYLQDDFTVRYDINGNPLAADVATANTIAAERTAQYFDRIYRGTSGYLRQTYSGVLPFYVGSLVDGVCWKQDQRPNNNDMGWQTIVVRGPEPAFPEVFIEVEK